MVSKGCPISTRATPPDTPGMTSSTWSAAKCVQKLGRSCMRQKPGSHAALQHLQPGARLSQQRSGAQARQPTFLWTGGVCSTSMRVSLIVRATILLQGQERVGGQACVSGGRTAELRRG